MSARTSLLPWLLLLGLAACEGVTRPKDLLQVRSLSAGPDHACAASTDGTLYCWGNNGNGAFGSYRVANSFTPLKIVSPPGVLFVQVTTGYSHACALAQDGQAYCWGAGDEGQLGRGAPAAGDAEPVAGGHTFTTLSAGWNHTCGVDGAGAAWCWGVNDHGQLGDSTDSARFAPVAVAGGLQFSSISAGGAHTCAVGTNGAGYCWGANDTGQLGVGTTQDAATPAAVAGGLQFYNISAGYGHSCGATTTGGYCWGSDESAELGNDGYSLPGYPGSTTPILTPAWGGLSFTQVIAGHHHSCGLVGGQAYCWGAGTLGQLGTGLLLDHTNPYTVMAISAQSTISPDPLSFVSISPQGITYTCGLTDARGAFCWGTGSHGELGRPEATQSVLPARVTLGH